MWFGVAQYCLNVMRPGRETQGYVMHFANYLYEISTRNLPYSIFLSLITVFLLSRLCQVLIFSFTRLCCNNEENPEEIDLGIPAFREYRGKPPWKKHKKRDPKYYLLFRKGRRSALRFKDNLPEPKPTMRIRVRLNKQKKKQARTDWSTLTPEERMQDQNDNWSRIKTKYLHDTFVMYDMQYGVDLDLFVKTLDPLKSFLLISALSSPEVISCKRSSLSCSQVYQEALNQADKFVSVAISKGMVSSTKPPTTRRQSVYISNKSEDDLPVVIDTGASFCLSPKLSDFITPIKPCTSTLIGLNSETQVSGTGIVEWVIQDAMGEVRTIKVEAYYVPEATIRLFSPQQYFKEHQAGHLIATHKDVTLMLPEGVPLYFPYQDDNNLPMMLTNEYIKSQSNIAGLSFEECAFLGNATLNSIVDTTNLNMTASQKELLLWHWKLGHAHMKWIQALAAEPTKKNTALPKPVLKTRPGSRMSSCERPICTACALSKQSRRTREGAKQRTGGRDQAIRLKAHEPGDQVSIDQYQSSFPGRLAHTKGKETQKMQYTGGTIFVDHASSFVFLKHQISLKVGETLRAKHAFEALCREHGVKIKTYRADNVPFGTELFRNDLASQDQTITFSGVGAHHQNGVAERAIGTITRLARTMLLQQAILWPDHADLKLWPFAMEQAVHIWNTLPRQDSRVTPMELLSRVKQDHHESVLRAHVWGCPVYVLDPKLQDGKKLPKWDPRARRGMYLGVSPDHSSSHIGRVLNLRTGHISPQFHMVFDDKFTTVTNTEGGGLVNPTRFDADHWERIIETGYESYLDPLEADLPDLDDSWLTPHERQIRIDRTFNRRARRMQGLHDPGNVHSEGENGRRNVRANESIPDPLPDLDDTAHSTETDVVSEGVVDDIGQDEGFQNQDPDDLSVVEHETHEADDPQVPTERDTVETDRARNGPGLRPRRTLRKPTRMNADKLGGDWVNYTRDRYSKKFKTGMLDKGFIQGLQWSEFVMELRSGNKGAYGTIFNSMAQERDPEYGTTEYWNPMALGVKADAASAADNPTFDQAMNGPDSEGYMKAAEIEVETLERKNTWEETDREDWMNVLPSTWAFKCKRYPDGTIRKFKGRFCVRGDKQIQGVDFFETYAPVVNWTTVRLLLVMSILLGLATAQADYTAAFVQSPIDKPPNWDSMTKEERDKSGVYVEMPRGFRKPGKVLRLNKSLYGLKQAPRNFFLHLKGNLEQAGFTLMTDIDPCLFVSDKVICLVYVDDCLLYSPDSRYIDETLKTLREQGMELETKDNVAGFLGVHIERHGDHIELTQKGLISRILDALGSHNLKTATTPATEP